MSLRLNSVVIDTNNLELLAGFWSALLGLEVTRRENDWISLDPHLAFQLVPEQKMAKNRIHLDLVADNFAAAIGRAKELGATPVSQCASRRVTLIASSWPGGVRMGRGRCR